MNKKVLLILSFVALLLGSCATPNVSYFTDFENGEKETIQKKMDIRLRPDDKISIVVNSKDPQLAALFNLPIMGQRVGYTAALGSQNSSQQLSLYSVDKAGEIDFPVLGKVRVAGYRRDEVASYIKEELIKQNLIKDPVVTVEYGNLGFNVMGEVNKAGRYTFDRDHLTILDAISMAGDLTIQGERKDVMVMRESGDRYSIYRVNLQNGKELLQSPAFYLQQNDIVYVNPNEFRARQTTVNGNNTRSTGFWISLASLLTSVAVLIFK